MQARITSAEFADWMAYNSLSPIGGERGDLQAAIVSSTVANFLNGNNDKSYSVADFMPKWDREEEAKEEFHPVTKAEAEEFLRQVEADGNR